MNKKDVEHIGYLLSDCHSLEEFKDKIIEWDNRIEEEYIGFEGVAGRDRDVDELFEKLIVERYGHQWAMLKDRPPVAEVLEEAQREVYGDNYELIFGKKSKGG